MNRPTHRPRPRPDTLDHGQPQQRTGQHACTPHIREEISDTLPPATQHKLKNGAPSACAAAARHHESPNCSLVAAFTCTLAAALRVMLQQWCDHWNFLNQFL